MSTRNCLVLGAAGFLGSAMEHRLKAEGAYVVSVARKLPPLRPSVADKYVICDLTNVPEFHYHFYHYTFDEVYQFASDSGGIGYIANSDNDAAIMTNSLKINLYTLEAIVRTGHANKIFFASSQCVYPASPPIDPFANERLTSPVHEFRESDASFDNFAFAKEKLFSEALYDAYRRNHGLTIRIGRLGNTYGPFCRLDDDRAKAPAAICRKVAEAPYAGSIRLWGNGSQIRTFTYVDDAIEGIRRLMDVDYQHPVNISSREAVTISELLDAVCHAAGKIIGFEPEDRPTGVHARSSDNSLALEVLGWEPTTPLIEGICKLYTWVSQQVLNQKVA